MHGSYSNALNKWHILLMNYVNSGKENLKGKATMFPGDGEPDRQYRAKNTYFREDNFLGFLCS